MANIELPAGSVARYDIVLVTPDPIGRRVGGAPVYATPIVAPVSLDLELTFTTDLVFDNDEWIDFVSKSSDLRNKVSVPVSHLGYKTPDAASDLNLATDCDAGSTSCRVVYTGNYANFGSVIGRFISISNELKLIKGHSQPSGGRVDIEFIPTLLQKANSGTAVGLADPTGLFLPSGDPRRLSIDGVPFTTFLGGETHLFLQAGPD